METQKKPALKLENIQVNEKVQQAFNRGAVLIVTAAPVIAFAEEGGAVDLSAGVATVTIVAGLLAIGAIKAVPTYTTWGIRKALSLLGR
ncbi:hypothetical protein F4V57_14670 [Acinetobacter qingfengensis]|uniref:Uncharacterized protein n=1 Tax=Acinetobacter qingfengensis TaxID=1262585 RepID=A0A1E7QZK2_9GAMM|nr:hypothetical protein [Acinetobacter qingfengensis]KAA8730792.1 hypothetical protein F4V57_14670 [Acinetobacter qingfengensis]OEY92538.1 hypothetical protein BJI46_14540 [Acinetobacter qingfengensis]